MAQEIQRFTGIQHDVSTRYVHDDQGRILRRITKEDQKRINVEEARDRILNNEIFKKIFPATEEGVNALLIWKDEDGTGFKDTDFILRTMNGNGELIVYDGDIKILADSKEAKEKAVNSLKADYKIMNDCGEVEYYDVRPIMVGNWKELTLKRKLASYTGKKMTKKEIQPDIIGKHD